MPDDEREIPALLKKSVTATPLPFQDTPSLSIGFGAPAAPAVSTMSAEDKQRAEFAEMAREAARLRAVHGIDFAFGNAVCDACKTTFGAVAPTSESVFKCPKCHTHRARWKYNFVKPGRHWACGCGSVSFRIREQGVYCPQCGSDQELPAFVKDGT